MNFGGPQALEKVQGPAIGLMIVGGLGVLVSVVLLLLNLLGVGIGAAGAGAGGADGAQMAQLMGQGVMGMIQCVIGAALSGLIIYGALQMKNLNSYGLAMTASILAMLPCTPCCICLAGLPIGIWSLVVLNDPVVKSSFR